jgi:hypothetical protein
MTTSVYVSPCSVMKLNATSRGLFRVGRHTAERKTGVASLYNASGLFRVGRHTAERKIGVASVHTASGLFRVGRLTAERKTGVASLYTAPDRRNDFWWLRDFFPWCRKLLLRPCISFSWEIVMFRKEEVSAVKREYRRSSVNIFRLTVENVHYRIHLCHCGAIFVALLSGDMKYRFLSSSQNNITLRITFLSSVWKVYYAC